MVSLKNEVHYGIAIVVLLTSTHDVFSAGGIVKWSDKIRMICTHPAGTPENTYVVFMSSKLFTNKDITR